MNGPSEETFRRVFQNLHQYKKEAVKLKKQKLLDAGKVKQPPCAICGKWFGSANQHFIVTFKPKLHCPTCEKNLTDGYTALVSLDGRFAFTKFPEANEAQRKEVAGKIITITNERMEMVQCTCMWIIDGVNRCSANANWESTMLEDGGGKAMYRFCSEHKEAVLKQAEEIEDPKLRAQVVDSFKAIVTLNGDVR